MLLAAQALAQQPYSWQLTDRDGLPSMEVYDLYQDAKGYIWIATDAGLCRYNGQTIKNYSHFKQKGTSASRISEDKEGRIWFQNFNGQLFFVEEDTLQLFKIPSLESFHTYFVHEQDTVQNILWIATKDSLYKYDWSSNAYEVTAVPTHANTVNKVTDIQYWSPDRLLFINNEQELWSKDSNQEKIWGKGERDIWRLAFPYHLDTIIIYSTNTIYLDAISVVTQFREQAKLAEIKAQIYRVFVDKDKNIWAGTSEGIYFWAKKSDGRFAQPKIFFRQEQVSSFCQDREGNYWFGTLRNGVFVIPNLDMQYYDTQNSALLNGQINKIQKVNEDYLLLGLSNGTVARVPTKNTDQMVHYISNAPSNNVTGLLYDSYRKQVLFFARRLFVFDWDDLENYEDYSPHLGFHQAIIYKENNLILGTNSGTSWLRLYPKIGKDSVLQEGLEKKYIIDEEIHRIENKTYYRYWLRRQRVNAIWADYTADNKFWVGYDDSLFYYVDGKTFSVLIDNKEPINTLDICQDKKGTIWVGTVNNGIYGIVDNRVQYHYTLKDGLPSNLCRTLTADGQKLWVGTNKGIFSLDLETNQVGLYNQLDGLVSEEIRDVEIANGRVWAATTRGLISFDKELSATNLTPPSIFLKAIEVNNITYPLQSSLALNYQQTNLKFHFEGLAFRARGNSIYEYRLLGLDSLWIEQPSHSSFVQFERLGAGKYKLEIRIKNEDGIACIQPVQLSFRIAQPYWQTWWFQGLSYLIVVVVIIALARWRYQIIQKRQNQSNTVNQLRMQALQSQMNPHFVFNAMSAIQGYWMQKQPKVALRYHAKFAKLMRLIFDYAKELTIDLDAELDFLEVYIALEQMRFEDRIEVIFEVEEALKVQTISIPPLLIQPIVENSFKHGFLHKKGKGKLLINLKKDGNYLYCIIEDNGAGTAVAEERKTIEHSNWDRRSSTIVVKERLDLLNQMHGNNLRHLTFNMTDLTNEQGEAVGTRTELWISLG